MRWMKPTERASVREGMPDPIVIAGDRRALILLVIAVLAEAGIAFLPSRVLGAIAANVLLMALFVVIGGVLLCRKVRAVPRHKGGCHGH